MALALLATLLVALVPTGTALHGNTQPSVTLCGTVQNEAGWPLEGIRVTAYGRGLTNADHLPRPTNTTGPDGTFTIQVLADFYRLVFEETQSASERGGARYIPFERPVAGHDYASGPCDASRGKVVAPTVLSAPMTGFLEVPVTDAIDGAALDGADVAVRPLGVLPWGFGVSDDGVARVSCPLHVPATLRIQLADYETLEQDLACTETLETLSLALWRDLVPVVGLVTDGETDEVIADATVTASPDTLVLPAEHPYTLSAASDDDGAYLLALPWGDSYTGTTDRGGYAPTSFTLLITADDLTSGIPNDLVLSRSQKTFTGTVTDVYGAGLVASLTFTGPEPATATHPALSAADGTFTLDLPVGTYGVSVVSAGKNDRTCSLSLPHDAAAAIDEGCLVLVGEGKGAVRGTVLDGLTAQPIGGITVTTGTTTATTDASGGWVLELAPGDHAVTFSEDFYSDTVENVRLARDEVLTAPDVSLQRETVDQTLNVFDSTDDSVIAHARVCPTFVPQTGAPVDHPCKTADETGSVTFDLQWTSRGGDFDVGDYTFTVERTTEAPFYTHGICAENINIDTTTATLPIECPAEIVPALATDIGPILDAHTGAPVTDATVTTSLPGGVDCGYYTCGATTDGAGSAVLYLPSGYDFAVAVSHGDYQSPPEATVPAGGEAFLNATLARVSHGVLVTATDAHTKKPLAGAAVSATPGGGFVCDPTGTFTCTGTTNEAGKIQLEVPHGEFAFSIADGAYDVVLDAQFGDIETGVQYYGADLGTFAVPGNGTLETSLLRQPGEPLVVNVTDFEGTPLDAARLFVASERFDGFVCDPDGRAPEYACRTHLDASSGSVVVELPHGTADTHTWNLTAQAPDHFREGRDRLASGSSHDIALWPLTFALTVDPVDVTTGETAGLVVVCILNLDEAGASPTTPPPPETCKASGVEAIPLVFDNVTWRRTATSDETDRFLVRAAGTLHFPATIVAEAGPAKDAVEVPLVPVDPTVPEPQATVVTGRVVDLDARLPLAGDGAGVIGARVFVSAEGNCPVTTFEGATGLDGTFQVPVLCHGDFTVQVVDPRYEQVDPQTLVVPQASPLDFQLSRIHQEATVRVTDATTAGPVEGASVALAGLDVVGDASGTTGADGTATFALPWGTYSVVVGAPAGSEWLVGDATSALVLTHTAPASADVVLVRAVEPPTPEPCGGTSGPDVCEPADDDGAIVLKSVTATDETGSAEAGNWLLVPPQLGAAPVPAIGGTASPTGYAGPHAGTWVVTYAPSSMAGLSGMPDFPITFSFRYEVGGEPRVLTASLGGPVVGPSPFLSPVLTWVVNLHDEQSAACGGPQVSCGLPGPVDTAAAAKARFYLP